MQLCIQYKYNPQEYLGILSNLLSNNCLIICIIDLFVYQAVTTPSLAVSHIMLEAYKKYVLVSLMLQGKLPPLPKTPLLPPPSAPEPGPGSKSTKGPVKASAGRLAKMTAWPD